MISIEEIYQICETIKGYVRKLEIFPMLQIISKDGPDDSEIY
jgi:hypothetical protein